MGTTRFERIRSSGLATLLLCVAGLVMSPCAAALEVLAVAQVDMFQMSEETFDSWVFSNANFNNAAEARKQIEAVCQNQVDIIEQVIGLTPEQRAKLELAGQCDVQRFFDDLAAAKRKAPMGMMPNDRINEIWQLAQPFSVRLTRGLNGHGSLFQKTILSTLTDAQLKTYQTLEEQRRARQYAAIVKAGVAMIDALIPMTRDQRERLITQVLAETTPPVSYGQQHYQIYLVLFQMSKVPEDRIRPIFNDLEWKLMSEVLRQGKQYEQMFRQQGLILEGEE